MVRAERFELPTFWFVARRSIQLSYARMRTQIRLPNGVKNAKSPVAAAPFCVQEYRWHVHHFPPAKSKLKLVPGERNKTA